MGRWKNQIYGYGSGAEQLSKESATMQLSLVDEKQNTISVKNSTEDFIMFIPRDQKDLSKPKPFGNDMRLELVR